MFVRKITQRTHHGNITKPDGRGYMEMLVNDVNSKQSTRLQGENVLKLRLKEHMTKDGSK
jgi:hypothetical protein